MTRWRILPVLLSVAGCFGGQRVEPVAATQAGPDKAFTVFSAGNATMVDQLALSGDSLLGSTIPPHPNAPRTRLSLPLAAVDSIVEAHPDRQGLALFLVPVAVVGGFLVWLGTQNFD